MNKLKGIVGPVLSIAFLSATAQAGGWVKGKNEFYTKVAMDKTSDRPFEEFFKETETNLSIYAEYGLPVNRPTQIQFYGAIRETTRTDPETDANFSGQSFTDSEIRARHKLGQVQLGSAGTTYFAGGVGFILPTTGEKFRVGNEEQRSDDVPEDKTYLIASIDRGKPGALLDLGLTHSVKSFWFNLSPAYKRAFNGDFSITVWDVAIGSGLPFNSWVQIAYSYSKSQDEIESSTTTESTSSTDTGLGASLGLTFWQGLALELGYKTRSTKGGDWEDGQTWSAGLSFRSL